MLIAFQIPIFGQTLDKRSFITYEEVINELESTDTISALENRYNYTFVLLLDSTRIDLIEKTGYTAIKEFRDYAMGLPLSKRTFGFVTEKQDIKALFKDKNALKKIIACTKPINSPDIAMTTFDYPVYIKENTAIFETSGPTWSDTYYARLEKGVLHVNWLGGIVE